MQPGDLLAYLIGGLFFAFACFPARAAYRCIRDGAQAELGNAVFRSITRTAFGLGLPLLIGFVALLNADSRGSGGGIMSKQMALAVLILLGTLALTGLWASALFVGFIATAVVRVYSPPKAALLMFLFMSFAPAVAGGIYAYEHARSERELQWKQRWGR